MHAISVLGYFLVYWEDSAAISAGDFRMCLSRKEGYLLNKTDNYLFGTGSFWTQAYFVLE